MCLRSEAYVFKAHVSYLWMAGLPKCHANGTEVKNYIRSKRNGKFIEFSMNLEF